MGAPALAVAVDRPRAGQARLGGDVGHSAGGDPVAAVRVLHRRGARDHGVLRARDVLRRRAGGGVPHHPAVQLEKLVK